MGGSCSSVIELSASRVLLRYMYKGVKVQTNNTTSASILVKLRFARVYLYF